MQSGSDEAGMMNMQRLSTEPSPLLRSVFLTTGIVGLLATSGPGGIQNTDAVPSSDINAPSRSIKQDLAEAPQLSSTLNDNLGRTDVTMAELSLSGTVASASISLDKLGR